MSDIQTIWLVALVVTLYVCGVMNWSENRSVSFGLACLEWLIINVVVTFVVGLWCTGIYTIIDILK